MDQIEDIKFAGNHVTYLLSYADLIQLGGYAAVEYCGGPSMIFRMGRQDAHSEAEVAPTGRLHEKEDDTATLFKKYSRMGFTKQEFVALLGHHTIGFADEDKTGFKARWTQNPYVFDNTYYKELLAGDRSKFFKSPAELGVLHDAEMKRYVEAYA
jgi:L-ascorbate peroxidase